MLQDYIHAVQGCRGPVRSADTLDRGIAPEQVDGTGRHGIAGDARRCAGGGEVPRLDGNPHAIAGAKPGAALVNLEKPWRAIRPAAGLDDVRLHDLRHAFASVAASKWMGLPIIDKMLGHTQPAKTACYAHLASDPVKGLPLIIEPRTGTGLPAMHPGKLLREEILPAFGRPRAEIAHLLGVSRQAFHAVLSERVSVTPEMALRLGKLCGNGPELWLAL